ncbi:MAG: GDSL-type esterase/lipase family protein [Eubacteriales bacterium]
MLILFQGDSITDGGRGHTDDPNHILGHSYPFIIASKLGYEFPERCYEFVNRAVSGDRVTNLYSRWQEDELSLSPDILSLLIGVNDAFEEVRAVSSGGTYCDRYEETYDLLIRQARAANPALRLIICEPFLLDSGNLGDDYPKYYEALEAKKVAAERIARRYNGIFIPLQKYFDRACANMTANYWVWDSVHPTYRGQGLIAKCWLDAASEIIGMRPDDAADDIII